MNYQDYNYCIIFFLIYMLLRAGSDFRYMVSSLI